MAVAEETLRLGARPLTTQTLALTASASAPQLSRANLHTSRAATAAPRTRSLPRDASPRHMAFAAGVPLRASFVQASHQGGAALLRELHALADHARPHRIGSPGSRGRARLDPSAVLLSGGVHESALASVLPRAPFWGGPAVAAAPASPPRSPSGAIRVVRPRRVEGETEAAWRGETWRGLSIDRLTPHRSPHARKRMALARLALASQDESLQAVWSAHGHARQPSLLPELEASASPLPPPRAAQSASASGRAAARIQASTVHYTTSEKLFASVMAHGATC